MANSGALTIQGWVQSSGGVQNLGPGGTGFVNNLTNAQFQEGQIIISSLSTTTTTMMIGTNYMIFIPSTEASTYTWTCASLGITVVMVGAPFYICSVGPTTAYQTTTIIVTKGSTDAAPSTLIYI